MQKLPKVTKKELVSALDRLCEAVGTTSRGLEVDAITAIANTYATVLEIKYETAVYDSNDHHDRWWMEPATNN